MKMFSYLFFGISIVCSLLLPRQTFADTECFQLNNGGVTNQQFCPTPTPQPSFPSQKTTQQTPPDKKVFPAPDAKATPNTGTEAISLFGLIPLAGAGFFLNKKAK